jgi:hypothetical protein
MDTLELQVTNVVSYQARSRESFQEVDGCLDRHHSNIHRTNRAVDKMATKFDMNTETLVGNLTTLEVRINLMVDTLCHCTKSPLSSQGTVESPYKLEYADDEMLTVYGAPSENTTPIPVATPTSSMAPQDSNAENIRSVPCAALHLIMDAEDDTGDKDPNTHQAHWEHLVITGKM